MLAPERCTATGMGLQDGIQQAACDALLELRDVAGERYVGQLERHRIVLSVVCGGRLEVPSTITDLGNGTYALAFARLTTGDYTASLGIDGRSIAGSPFSFSVRSKIDVSRTRVFGPGVESHGVQSLCATSFVVEALDVAGQPASARPSVTCSINGRAVDVALRAEQDGHRHVCSYLWALSGLYRVYVALADEPVPGSPFSIEVGPTVDAAKTLVSLGEEATQGNRGLAEIRLRSISGEAVSGLAVEQAKLTVQVVSPSGATEEAFVRASNDSYRARFDQREAGRYRLLVSVGGTALDAVVFRVAQQLDRSTMAADGPALQSGAQSTNELIATVSANDVCGAPFDFDAEPSQVRRRSAACGPCLLNRIPLPLNSLKCASSRLHPERKCRFVLLVGAAFLLSAVFQVTSVWFLIVVLTHSASAKTLAIWFLLIYVAVGAGVGGLRGADTHHSVFLNVASHHRVSRVAQLQREASVSAIVESVGRWSFLFRLWRGFFFFFFLNVRRRILILTAFPLYLVAPSLSRACLAAHNARTRQKRGS